MDIYTEKTLDKDKEAPVKDANSPDDSDSGNNSFKVLSSDLNAADVYRLLLRVQQSNPLYGHFNKKGLRALSQIISAFKFQRGQQILHKGEASSFR